LIKQDNTVQGNWVFPEFMGVLANVLAKVITLGKKNPKIIFVITARKHLVIQCKSVCWHQPTAGIMLASAHNCKFDFI